jgi:hypothetical protein
MSFIEMMVTVGVFVFAMLAITSSVQYFYRTNTYAIEQSSAVAEAQRGVETVVKAMREATHSSAGAYPIITFGPSEFAFYANIDSDAFIERIRYFVQGTSLMREVTDPSGDPPVYGAVQVTSIISETVRNLEQNVDLFAYYDAEGDLITDYSDIGAVRFVTMNIVVNVNPDRLPNQLTLRSSAALRNVR